ncbi:MAG: IPT/TIG domain-containing protein [bacterium]
MAINLEPVNRGDLITAEFINDIVAAIKALDMKVSALEAVTILDTNIHITAIFPDPVRVGQTLTIVGKNFDFSIGAHRVYIDSIRIVAYQPGSSDNQLIFNVPAIPRLPALGRQVTLTASNKSSSISKTITVLPVQQVLQGNVDVSYLSTFPATIIEGDSLTFHFRLISRTNLPADFLITPNISITSWQPNLQVRDDSSVVIPSRIIHLEKYQEEGSEKDFEIHLPNVPAGTSGTDFTLTVNAEADSVKGSSGLLKFTVGSPVPEPDPNIELTYSIFPSSALIGDTIQLAGGTGEAILSMIADFKVTGHCDLTITLSETTSNWDVTPNFGTPSSFDINPAQPMTLEFTISPQSGASNTGEVEFRLQRVDETRSQSLIFHLLKL